MGGEYSAAWALCNFVHFNLVISSYREGIFLSSNRNTLIIIMKNTIEECHSDGNYDFCSGAGIFQSIQTIHTPRGPLVSLPLSSDELRYLLKWQPRAS